MKRVLPFLLSIHLLVISLLPGGDTRVLLDTAAAQEHHDEDHADSGLWDFVYDHYLGGEHHHDNGDDHSSMPFHHAHSNVGAVVLFFQASAPFIERGAVPSYASARKQPRLVTPAALRGIIRLCWQPPRA